jgi:hypothetical protein
MYNPLTGIINTYSHLSKAGKAAAGQPVNSYNVNFMNKSFN